jgi:RNA-binding protein YhbY
LGKEGVSPHFLAALNDALKHHELVKVKFDDFNPDFPYKLHKTMLLT